LYYRSDHYNFARKGIPVIFYFSGLHADYHKATDDAEKINLTLLTKRTYLIFSTLKAVAAYRDEITVDKSPKE
jgi:Zn-dependent M28 family amino/carboxypeptidase